MGWRVRRSIRVGKGYRINFSKSGISTSTKLGPVTINSRRGTTIRVAKGLSYHVDQGERRPTSSALAEGSTAPRRSCLGTAVMIVVIAVVALVLLGIIVG